MSRARSTQGLGRTSAAPSSSLSPMMASTIPEDPGAGEAYDMTELEDAIARAYEAENVEWQLYDDMCDQFGAPISAGALSLNAPGKRTRKTSDGGGSDTSADSDASAYDPPLRGGPAPAHWDGPARVGRGATSSPTPAPASRATARRK